tara:strand:- start:47 stop:319 length:273 start_codon:yes stop_codon:yes gene_type:complete
MKDRLKAALEIMVNKDPLANYAKGACKMKHKGKWCCADSYKEELCKYYEAPHRGGWKYYGRNTRCKDVAPKLPNCGWGTHTTENQNEREI